MTRWYYSEPLAAEWQQARHGVQFDRLTVDGKICIDPGCHYLLNAQKGDLVLLANGMEAYRYSTPAKLDRGEKIIMRNGQHFFWPEMEGV